jgi:protein SCO1/2
MAMAHKEENVKNYGRKGSESGWHFLTGTDASIKALAKSIGYRYVLDPATKEYVHPDGLTLLTPQGRVSRYFYNLNYPVRDVKFGLMEASQSKIGSPLDYLAMSCFHYNPTTGKYSPRISAILQIAGISTVLGMALGISLMLRSEKKRDAQSLKPQSV